MLKPNLKYFFSGKRVMKAVFGKFLYEDLAFCLEAFNLKESEKLFEKIEQLRGEFDSKINLFYS